MKGGVLNCSDSVYFTNYYGTCWNVSSLMILIFGDKTREITQTSLEDKRLQNNEVLEYYESLMEDRSNVLNALPYSDFVSDNIDYLNEIFARIAKRVQIKRESEIGRPLLLRQESQECARHGLKAFFQMIGTSLSNKTYDKDERNYILSSLGGDNYSQFSMILLLSVFLYKKLIDMNIYSIEDEYRNKLSVSLKTLDDGDISKALGILVHFKNHVSSIYNCNSVQKFYNDNLKRIYNYNMTRFIIYIRDMLKAGKNIGVYGKYDDDIKLKNGFDVPNEANLFIVDFVDNKLLYIDETDMREMSATLAKSDLNNDGIYEVEAFCLLNDYIGDVVSFKKKYVMNYLIYLILKKQEKIDDLFREIGMRESDILNLMNSNVESIPFAYYITNYMDSKAVETMLKYGYDINTKIAKTETTILMDVVIKGDSNTVKVILDKKPDVNLQDNSGFTALMFAMATRYLRSRVIDPKIVTDLLDVDGLNVNLKDNNGFTALAHLLTSLTDITITPEIHNIIIKMLSRSDIDVNTKTNNGVTLCMFAIMMCSESKDETRHIAIDELLKRSDIDLCAQDNEGKTALMYAISLGRNCRKYILDKLLPKDFSNEKIYDCMALVDNEKRNWLMYAIIYRHTDFITEHLPFADKDSVDIYGKTALMYAIGRKYNDIAELLIDDGADLNIRDIKGLSALDYAKKYNNKKIAEKIMELTTGQTGGKFHSKRLYSFSSDILKSIL
jgi:ankyrin repeat protein